MVPPTSSNRQLPPHRVPLEARGGGGFPNDTPDPDPNQQKDEEEEPHAQLPRGEELLFGVVGRWGRFFIRFPPTLVWPTVGGFPFFPFCK